jgi:hypothetical protein
VLPLRTISLNSTHGGNNYLEVIPQMLFMEEKFHLHPPCMKIIAILLFNTLNIRSGCHDYE